MARELVSLKPDVLDTHTGTGLQAATLARTSIPIIVGVASDLEIWRLEGLSQSLAHALTPRTQAVQAKR